MLLVAIGASESEPFTIKNQVTLFASGLECEDEVVLEIVTISRSKPSGNHCCPGPVVLPFVKDKNLLTLCGGNGEQVVVKMTAYKPWVVLDMPQQIPLRVLVGCGPNSRVEVELFETSSKGVNCVGGSQVPGCSE